MRTRWRALITFVFLPLGGLGFLWAITTAGVHGTQALLTVIAMVYVASFAVGWVHRRRLGEAVVYTVLTAPLTLAAMLLCVVVPIAFVIPST